MLLALFASLIGFSLGLLGGGGSVLTVPVLVYLFHFDSKLAVAMSLGLVGITASVAFFGHYRQGNFHQKVALLFTPFTMVGAYIGSYLSQFISGEVQLILFSIVMMVASVSMFRGRKEIELSDENHEINYFFLIIQGLFVGVLTGVVGVGGGFLIVPFLIFLAKIDIKKAIGTSLLIIFFNSITGFLGYLQAIQVPWVFFFKFLAFSLIGVGVGIKLSSKVPQQQLKKIFAVFLLIIGFYILYQNKNVFINMIG